MEVLNPDDDSPFLLGDLKPGTARLAADTNMFRAGLVLPQTVQPLQSVGTAV